MTKTDLKTFDDLDFGPHPIGRGGVQAKIKFDNDYEISVVGGALGLYGNGTTSFEVAIFTPEGEFYQSPNWDDQVMGWLDKDSITKIMSNIQNKK